MKKSYPTDKEKGREAPAFSQQAKRITSWQVLVLVQPWQEQL